MKYIQKKELEAMQEIKEKVEEALMLQEQKIMNYIETNQVRVTVAEAVKVLVVTGNALLFLPPKEGGMKLYKLHNYVLQRDALGNMVQLVTLDKIAYVALPDDVRAMVDSKGKERKPDEQIEVYTHAYIEGKFLYSYQEVEDEVIPRSQQKFPLMKSPWIPIRMVKIDGESYGRSFVEEYLGDLRSLEALSKAIVELSAIAANVVFLVNPNGITRVRNLSKAKPGEFVPGKVEDINALQLQKYADLQVAEKTASAIEARLCYAFLLNSAVQRNGERVTAEEIRYVAGELEDTLGGIYSILSQELQLPLVRRLLAQLQSMGQIPNMPEDAVAPTITTGLEALGRGHDLNKLKTYLEFVSQLPGAPERLKMGTLLTMTATALNLDTTNLVKSDEEVQQEMQAQYQMQLMQQATPNLAKGFADAQLQGQQGGGK